MASGRFVLLSDPHVHPWAAFASGDGARNSRLVQTLKILDQSLAEAQRLGVPWVCAGDLVHTAGHSLNVVLAGITDVLQQYPEVIKLAVWGNHDARGIGGRIVARDTVWGALRHTVKNLIVLDPVDGVPQWQDPITGLTYSGAGYQPSPEFLEWGAVADVGVYHQTVGGSLAPSGVPLTEGIPAAILRERHRVSVVGHVHRWQYVGAVDDRMVLVPGAPEAQNFGDTGPHGWWVVTVPEPEAQIPEPEFRAGGSPEFRTVATPSDVAEDGHYYRVERVPPGAVVPDSVRVLSPGSTTIDSRDVLRGARGEAAVAAWLKHAPPEVSALIAADAYSAAGLSFWAQAVAQGGALGQIAPVRLTAVSVQDFGSHAKTEWGIRDGVTLILGRGRDYPSNGAGKTTLAEAVYWTLFGATTKGLSGDDVIRWDQGATSVTLHFDDGMTVTRSKVRGQSMQLRVIEAGAPEPWAAASVSELTKRLQLRLGVSPQLFQVLGYFSQERVLLFSAATDGQRKEMLADLVGSSGYATAAELASAASRDAEAQQIRAVALRDAAEAAVLKAETTVAEVSAASLAWVGDHHQRLIAAQAYCETVRAEKPARVQELIAVHQVAVDERYQREKAALTARLLQERTNADAKLAAVTATLAAVQAAAPAQSVSQAAVDVLRQAVTSARAVEAEARGKKAGVEVQEAELNRRARTIVTKLSHGVCPECQQPITDAHREQHLVSLRTELEAVRAALASASADHTAALDALSQRESALHVTEGELRELAAHAASMQRAEAEVESARRVVAAFAEKETTALHHLDQMRGEWMQTAVAEVEAEVQRAVAQVEHQLASVEAEKNPHTESLRLAERSVTEATANVTAHGASISDHAKAVAVAKYWAHGFSKQGLQSLLLDDVAALFNTHRGRIFPALTQGVYDVQFSTTSQTKSGEWRERTEFVVTNKVGVAVPYDALSGGQRRRVDVGVMLTLLLAVAEWMRVPGTFGLLVLDEVFGFLDASGAEGLVEALRAVREVVPAVYVVTHDPHLQALLPDAMTVVQGPDGASHLEVA